MTTVAIFLGVLLGAEQNTPNFALLVGVEHYPRLSTAEQLEGCANDVQIMRTLLLEPRFGFESANIKALVNEEATGTAIRAEWARLVHRVQALPPHQVAQVVFHFSGHGAQIADQAEGDPDADEVDGLDETLVPFDAGKQGGTEDLRDDELYNFVEKLSAGNKAKVWMILDCCHSGTGARGATRLRKLDRGLQVKIPQEGRKIQTRRLPPGVVILSACRAHEVEPEYAQENEKYGLLTSFLTRILREQNNLSQMSYELLQQSITARYRQSPDVIQPPSPQLEGDGQMLRGTVLGLGKDADRPAYWHVNRFGFARDRVLIHAGAFHGVTVGSLFELFPGPEKIVWQTSDIANNKNFWLQVEKVEGATAHAKVFQWHKDERQATELPSDFKQGVAVERWHDYGSLVLRVRCEKVDADDTRREILAPQNADVPPVIRSALTTSIRREESPWLKWVDAEEPCDILLRWSGDYYSLFPAMGRAGVVVAPTENNTIPTSLRGGWGPIDARRSEDAISLLQTYLRRICRARNLLRLIETQRGLASPPVQLELVDVDVDDATGTVRAARAWKIHPESGLVIKSGQRYAYRVTNLDTAGNKPWYVTILHVDPDMGIDQILPYQEGVGAEVVGEQKLVPGEQRVSDAFECDGGFGQRVALVLATREPNDFYMLAQPSLPQVRGQISTNNSILNELLLEQTYFRTTRGGAKRLRPQKLMDESWSASSLTFFAQPE